MNFEPDNLLNVFLIGYRCTGKSSVGKSLATRLDWFFVDTDSLLVAESQTSIKAIVDSCGWEEFRKLEREVIKRVCAQSRQIVATGGGAVLEDANVRRMKSSGKVVWLLAQPDTIRRRMIQDTGTAAFRPALTSKDSITEIEETLLDREPYYSRAMDIKMDTDDRQVDEICDTIIRNLLKLDSQFKEAHSS